MPPYVYSDAGQAGSSMIRSSEVIFTADRVDNPERTPSHNSRLNPYEAHVENRFLSIQENFASNAMNDTSAAHNVLVIMKDLPKRNQVQNYDFLLNCVDNIAEPIKENLRVNHEFKSIMNALIIENYTAEQQSKFDREEKRSLCIL